MSREESAGKTIYVLYNNSYITIDLVLHVYSAALLPIVYEALSSRTSAGAGPGYQGARLSQNAYSHG